MMHDPLDLSAVARMAPPPALDALEEGVFTAIEDARRQAAASRRMACMSVAGALALGLAGGIVAGGATPAQASPVIGIGIGIGDAPSPSSLLLGR